jgi:DNA-binding MurR/RpiR family transcriptional regulator
MSHDDHPTDTIFEASHGAGVFDDPTVLIRSALPSLSKAEHRVAEGILANPREAVSLNIGALAEEASTSEATVVRFCQNVGFSGFPALRIALAAELGRTAAEGRIGGLTVLDIGPEDSLSEITAKVGALDAQAISNTVAHLDIDALGAVVEAIANATRIEIYGIGASGLVAADLEHKLRRIGLPAAASTDGHAALTSAAVLCETGIAIGISHSGTTLDVVDPLALARSHGATTVAITNFTPSAVTEVADLVLTTAARESALRAGAMASRAAQLTIVDCVYLAVARMNYEDTVAALELTSDAVKTRRTKTRS